MDDYLDNTLKKKYIIELTDAEFECLEIGLGEAQDHAEDKDYFDPEIHHFTWETWQNTQDALFNAVEVK